MEGSQSENSASATGSQTENTARGSKEIKFMSELQNENTTNESLVLTPMIESKSEIISTESLDLKPMTVSQTENTTNGGPDIRPMKGPQAENAPSISINTKPVTASQTEVMAREGEEIQPMSGLGNENTDTENIDIKSTGRSENEDKGLACHFACIEKAYTRFRRMPAPRRRLVLFSIALAMSTVLVVIVFGSLFHQMKNTSVENSHATETTPTHSPIPTSLTTTSRKLTFPGKEEGSTDNQVQGTSNSSATDSTISTIMSENNNTSIESSYKTETTPTHSPIPNSLTTTSRKVTSKEKGSPDNEVKITSNSSATEGTSVTSVSENGQDSPVDDGSGSGSGSDSDLLQDDEKERTH